MGRRPPTAISRGSALAWSLFFAVAGAALVACLDLFHSTADVLSACEIDARASGCAPPAASTDFCSWSPTEARAHAQRACAWVGACETPFGRNAFGPCMFQALLAYDCAANPNHGPDGKAHDLWDCLWQVKSCGDVDRCVFPAGVQPCAGGLAATACGTDAGGGLSNADVRLACAGDGGVARGESCVMGGQSCTSNGAPAACTGTGGASCSIVECASGRTQLVSCDGGADRGIDCAQNGAGICVGVGAGGAAWVACLAESDAEACVPDASASCSGGVASSCPSGVPESIDCAALVGGIAACNPGPLTPAFDWTSPCGLDAGTCIESCADGGLFGCVRGGPLSASCDEQGLGPCREVSTVTGPAPACAPP
jgi:hypothetical protein